MGVTWQVGGLGQGCQICFLSQIREIWLFLGLVGVRKFCWLFGFFLHALGAGVKTPLGITHYIRHYRGLTCWTAAGTLLGTTCPDSVCVLTHTHSHSLPGYYSTGADTGFPDWGGGGGVKTFTSTPPPLEKHPHSWTFTSTPPWTLSAWRHPPSVKLKNTPTLGPSQAHIPWAWTLPVWRHPQSKGGGGVIGPGHAHFA